MKTPFFLVQTCYIRNKAGGRNHAEQLLILSERFQDDPDAMALIRDVAVLSKRYIDLRTKHESLVAKMAEGISGAEYRDQVLRADTLRSRAHDSLIANLNIVNRLCLRLGMEELVSTVDREVVADYARAIVRDLE